MDIGKRMKERRKQLKMTADEIADKLGVSRATIYRYEKGDIEKFPIESLEPLAEALQTTSEYLMGWEFERDILPIYKELNPQRQIKVYHFAEAQLHEQNNKVVPLVGSTAANPTVLDYADQINDVSINIEVPNSADCALVVRGDSMEPDYTDGSIVFYKRQETVENGELAIIEIDGDGVTFKKILFDYDNQQVILRSLNTDYPDRVLKDEEYRIIGKVVK